MGPVDTRAAHLVNSALRRPGGDIRVILIAEHSADPIVRYERLDHRVTLQLLIHRYFLSQNAGSQQHDPKRPKLEHNSCLVSEIAGWFEHRPQNLN